MSRLSKLVLIGLLTTIAVAVVHSQYLGDDSRQSSTTPKDSSSSHEPSKQPTEGAKQARNITASNGKTVASLENGSSEKQEKSRTLVRFSSPAAQEKFTQENNLSAQDIVSVEQLRVYAVAQAGLRPTEGARVFDSQRYMIALTPQDTHYNLQWYLGKVGAPATWNNTVGGTAPTVAVIDTGFGLAHEDLESKWALNSGESGVVLQEGSAPNCTSRSLALDKSCNNIDDDGDSYVDNHTGWDFVTNTNSVQAGEVNPVGNGVSHGTLVSGLIAAETNNSLGISGMSWESQVLPIQALSDDGDGDTLSVALGIHYAVTHGAKVINMSLSSDGDDPIVAEQVQYALDSGVTVVAAAGNDGVGQLGYPANYPGVIAVGATDSSDNRAGFSNFGSNLAIVAPGTSSICSTAWMVNQPTDGYVCGYSGTSFSAPIVAGAAALLIAQDGTLAPAQVKTALASTATKVAGMSGQNFTTRYGYGRLNTYEALKSVSLAAPLGQVLNTHAISLAAVAGMYRPEMNSTCTSYYASAKCRVRAVNTTTNQIIWLAGGPETGPELNEYWNALSSNLSAGAWLIQSFVEAGEKRSLVREESLTVNP